MSETQTDCPEHVSHPTVTVTRVKSGLIDGRYMVRLSNQEGEPSGPFPFPEAVLEVHERARLDPVWARDIVMDAAVRGSATRRVGRED